MSPAADSSAARLEVVAVVVSHDGAEWLPHLLDALGASSRAPDRIVAVDTGSTDDSVSLLAGAIGADAVVRAGRDVGFGGAVSLGLAAVAEAPPSTGRHAAPSVVDEWVWLLHDDCAPASGALESLVELAATDPDIAAVGCRVRDWPDTRRLLEAGVTISGTGHRETGLEPDEHDQGQYDEPRDVLAVSSAGMLVRRRVWDALGGLDPRLPLFRDDVDLGWRAAAAGHRVVVAPRAVLFHVEAASRGTRDSSGIARRPQRADRAAAMHTVLANCRPAAVPFLYLRFWVGCLLRAVGYLLGKLPGAAWDEVAAAGAVLGRPWRIVAARSWRRSRRETKPVGVRRLLPPWWSPYARGLDITLSRLAGTFHDTAGSVAASARRLRGGPADPVDLETGPVPDEAVNLPAGDGVRAALSRHPLLAVVVLTGVASLVTSRGLWGGGFLQGGALLPAPDGVGDWWTLFAQTWHPVGPGSTLDTAPYVVMLAVPATLLLGKAWLLVDLLMLFAAPLAGLGAWFATGRLVQGVATRVWMSVTYALVPVVTGAVTSGHLGTVVVAVVLPWVVRSACRLLEPGDDASHWGSAWATGLMLSIATAFAPVSWPIAALVGVVVIVGLALQRRLTAVCQWLVALALPVLLLLPWSWRVISDPHLLLTEAGAVDVPGASLSGSGWQLAFGRIGAAGQAPWWLGVGLTFVALAALARRDTRAKVTGAWLVVAAGLVAASLMWRLPVDLPLGAGQAYAWLGVPVLVASAGAIAAAGIASDGLGSFIGSGSFGWRQPLAVVAVAAGLVCTVLGLGWWVGAAPHGDLRRDVAVPVPAYMIDAMTSGGQRILVLRTDGDTIHYQVLGGDGLRLGDDSVLPASAEPRLASLIGGVLSESHAGDAQRLAGRGIGYVVLPSGPHATAQNRAAAARLDAVPGLTRTSTDQAVLSGWQVAAPVAVSTASTTSGARVGWLVGIGLAWLVVAILAAPRARRPPLQTDRTP